MFSNGEQVIAYFDELLNDILDKDEGEYEDQNRVPFQPVTLLLLDIDMPIMDGAETVQIIKEKFVQFNLTLNNKRLLNKKDATTTLSADETVLRPIICFLSQLEKAGIVHKLTEDEQADGYLEKPLPLKDLICLLRLLQIEVTQL